MPSLLVSAHTRTRTSRRAAKELMWRAGFETKYLLHICLVERAIFQPSPYEGSTYSITTDRETRAEPSNRDRHRRNEVLPRGAEEGGKCLLRSRNNVMLDGMMCFDDETTCRMVTFGIDGICNSLLKLQAFLLDGM
jgi:hypothetical protein